jgi:transposase, IS5 family
MASRAGFFDLDERYRALTAAGDALERLARAVEFEVFRPELEAALARSNRGKGGRPPYDPVLMFRILVLQTLYTLSDDQIECQLRDRLSFMRFVGLALHDPVPDAKTIWLFRERLTRAGAVERLFRRFDAALKDKGLLAMGGQILDATVVQARPARLTVEERAILRDGKTPAAWSPARRAQIDRDARWTLKRGRKRPPPEGGTSQHRQVEIAVPVFGYKSHIGIDRQHGLIRAWTVTHAAAHDGGQLVNLLDAKNTASPVWADTAYRSAANLAAPAKRGLTARLQRPKPRGKPMPPHVRRGNATRGNATRGRVRAAVEHVFACQKRRLRLVVRTVGLARATTKLGLANLAYNLLRLVWLEGRTAPA